MTTFQNSPVLLGTEIEKYFHVEKIEKRENEGRIYPWFDCERYATSSLSLIWLLSLFDGKVRNREIREAMKHRKWFLRFWYLWQDWLELHDIYLDTVVNLFSYGMGCMKPEKTLQMQ